MYEELNISESEGVWAAYLALCDLKEETERLQAACAAKTAELAELREQTAELFADRVAAEGADDDAVHAAMVMWVSDPQSAAQAVLGCDIAEAANPYGCNQYGHEWKGKHGDGWKPSGRGGASDKKKETTEKKEEWKNPNRRPDGSFNIPSIGKALPVPTPNPGEKRPPIFKPEGMSDKEFRDFLDSDNPHRNKGKATLSDTEADDLVGDLFEIAMEEGGYERLYDVPKEKLKDAIKRELKRSGSREMFGDVDTGEDGNPAKYRWWRKNVKRIVDSL